MAGESIGNLVIKTVFDGNEANAGVDRLSEKITKLGDDSEKQFSKFRKLGEMIGNLGKGGGLQIAIGAGVISGIGKLTADATRMAIELEKAAHNAESLQAAAEKIKFDKMEWDKLGVIGKSAELPGQTYEAFSSSLGHVIKNLAEFADQLTGLSSYLDERYKDKTELASGSMGPITAMARALGLGKLEDWSNRVVGAETVDERRAREAKQADVLAQQKKMGAERQKFESDMEKMRDQLSKQLETPDDRTNKEIEELTKLIREIASKPGGGGFGDVVGLARRRQQQLLQEKADREIEQQARLAEAAKRQADEQARIQEQQQRAAEKAAEDAQRLIDAQNREQERQMDMVRRAVDRVPEVKQIDPFAGVSLAGSQEAYRDRIMSQFPPEVLSVQERVAIGVENLLDEQRKQFEMDQEILRALQAPNGPKLAHML
jgi:2C-methyl-D-erythritol 2,4-cyclodiphosphate synthase